MKVLIAFGIICLMIVLSAWAVSVLITEDEPKMKDDQEKNNDR